MPSERRGSLMRVVFDTNVIVPGLSSPRAPPAELLERLEGGLITLVTSGPQIDELRDMRAKITVPAGPAHATTGRMSQRGW